jgi:hypothetical protein
MIKKEKTIIDIGLKAIICAERYYIKAAGRTVRTGPESFVQSRIFQELSKLSEFSKLTLEERTRDVLKELGGKTLKLENTFRHGQIDILIWSRSKGPSLPQYPIEIKIVKDTKSFSEDARRLKAIVDKRNKLPKTRRSMGFIFGYSVRSSEASVRRILEAAGDSCGVECKKMFSESVKTVRRDRTEAWFGAACYCIL